MFPYLQISEKYFTIWGDCLSDQCINPLWPVDLIWSLWPWSSLVQVKVSILTSDCVNAALSKNKVQWNLNKNTIMLGHLNLLSAKWWPFCSGLIVMIILVWLLYSCLRIIVKKPILRIHITHTHTHIYMHIYICSKIYPHELLPNIYIYIQMYSFWKVDTRSGGYILLHTYLCHRMVCGCHGNEGWWSHPLLKL